MCPPRGGTLARFFPPVVPDATNWTQKARAAVAPTFVAEFELAREGALRPEPGGRFRDSAYDGRSGEVCGG